MYYDRNGNLLKQTSAEGQVFEFQYDGWDRLRQLIFPADKESERTRVEYSYGKGNVVKQIRIVGLKEPGATGTLCEVSYDYDEGDVCGGLRKPASK